MKNIVRLAIGLFLLPCLWVGAVEPRVQAKKERRPAAVGPVIGENKATPVERIRVLPGFKVELLYSVPGGEQGSWVALCSDPKGRIYVSDQYGDLYRFTPPELGKPLERSAIHRVPVNIRAINGMVWAFGALYAGVNDYESKLQSGFYRISDTDGDDELDKVELLRAFDSKSDHGVHAVVPTSDGKGFFLVTGNNAVLAEGPMKGTLARSPVPKVWGDDHLLPRMPDGRGHNRHVMAPGGIIYRVTPDGKDMEIFASGFRNIYDAALNRRGDLFTYDADMEYDFNTPWYRPTRINHVVSGGEYGWRNGAGKYPEFYGDNLPSTLNIGPGSPTGTTFGYGAKFPRKYQEALFVLDWSWGKIYAVHLKPQGSTYTASKEEFVTGGPLPVTDAIVGADGAMYFAIGGRRVQSGLYRVTYVGGESTAPVLADVDETVPVDEAVRLRRRLESFHGRVDDSVVGEVWPYLGHKDRWVRWAARTGLEHQPVKGWAGRAFEEAQPLTKLEALLAMARAGGVCPTHRMEGHMVDGDLRDRLVGALLGMDVQKLDPECRALHVRIAQIVLHRFGNPAGEDVSRMVAQYDALFPASTFEMNWLLCETLSYLQSPTVAAKGMALIEAAESQEPQMEYARSLRMLRTGWTLDLRKRQLEWFLRAANYRGGASFSKFIEFIRNDSLETFSSEERQSLAELIARKPETKSVMENVGAIFAGRTPTAWTLEELSAAASGSGLKGRDFEKGRRMFGAAACYSCHRFGNAGGMTGPDLTGAGGRYSAHDLLDQIINPSKEINEQFAPIIATRNSGEQVSGVVVNLGGDTVTLNTDLSDPNQRVSIDRKDLKSIELSKISPMPPMLLSMLTKDEVLDLLAYILSGGDRAHAMFSK
jgi:putative heme-binding domain-containing protein